MRVVSIRSAWSPCYSKDPCISKKCNFLVFASKAKINIFGICFWCRGTKASPYFKKKKTSKNVEIAAFEVIVETHFYIALYLFFYFLGLYGSYSTTKNHSQRNQGGGFGTWNYTPTSFEIHDSKSTTTKTFRRKENSNSSQWWNFIRWRRRRRPIKFIIQR